MDKIKKVCIYKQDYYGGKTDNITLGKPKLLAEFKSIKLAKQAVEDFGSFTHTWQQIMCNVQGTESSVSPALIRNSYGNERDIWGYEFTMFEKGLFGSKDQDKYPAFKMYYEVMR